MKLETETLEGGVERVALGGRLDIDGTQAVETRFSFLTTTSSSAIVVDLAGVTFLASIGIRMIMTAARARNNRGGMLVLAGAQDAVKKVLLTAGIDKVIHLYDDVETARAALAAH